MVNSKGQMKTEQMTFMLLAVTLFFVLAGLFVFAIFFQGVKSSSAQVQQENAMYLVSKLSNSPEFTCGGAFQTSGLNCVDEDRVMALSENSGKYSNFWGVEGIQIRQIYPLKDANIVCNSSNYPDCGIINVLPSSQGTSVSNFVALCRYDNSSAGTFMPKCNLAEIVVTYNGTI